jgi:hypothetical protein
MLQKVKIPKGQIGLVFKKGDYETFLLEGEQYLWNKQLRLFNLNYIFSPPIELEILLEDKELAKLLDVVDIKDNELGICFEEGKFKQILTTGRYVFWKNRKEREIKIYDRSDYNIPDELDKGLFGRLELQPFIRSFTVEPTEKALFYENYNFKKVVDAGKYYFWKNETVITILTFDLRQQQLEVLGQEILTKDKAGIRINFLASYKIIDVEKVGLEVKDYKGHLYTALQLALREYAGDLSLDEILVKKEDIGTYVFDKVKDKAIAIGVELLDAGVKDIILPGEIKDILNQVLIAEKKAQANIITRREETASTRSLLNTAKLMEDNPVLFKLKELEYVERLSEKISQINVSGGGHILEQLKDMLVDNKKNN